MEFSTKNMQKPTYIWTELNYITTLVYIIRFFYIRKLLVFIQSYVL